MQGLEEMAKIAIAGMNGFVGSYLEEYFKQQNIEVVAIDREVLSDYFLLKRIVSKADVVINLAGEPILKRWSSKHKRRMYQSRIETTKVLADAINASDKDQLFISTSAIGIYENDIMCDEEDYIYGQTFLTHMCKDWEKEALKVHKRVAIFRLGVVLGEGGALQKILPSFRLGIGGKVGDGTQPFSYIHIEDLARAYLYVISHHDVQGVFNLTTPMPVNNQIFTNTLATKLETKAVLPVPMFTLKTVLGEGAQVLSNGQKVYPKRLVDAGFNFKYQDLETVLEDLV